MNSIITGEASRQAVECLGGYAYQIYASALAWATLSEGEVLHLEVAEDFAISTNTALDSVQVKRTEAKVTSNSAGIISALNSFVTLTLANPTRIVSLRYLTTSEIGLEKRKADRVDGEAFICSWDRLRKSGDLQPLRRRLADMGLSQQTNDFLVELSDAELRKRVLRRLWFDCGQPGFEGLNSQLNDALVEIGARRGVFAVDSERVRAALIEEILKRSSDPGDRELTRSDFFRLFDQQNTTSIPNTALLSLIEMSVITDDVKHTSLSKISPPIEPIAGDPRFDSQAPRGKLLEALAKRYRSGFLWMHAGTGYGKTVLARTLVHREKADGGMLRLRDMPPRQTAGLLDRARSELLFRNYDTIVIDDIAGFEMEAVAAAVRSLVGLATERGMPIIFTSYFRPSDASLVALNLPSQCCIEIEKLTDEDLSEMVRDAPAHHGAWEKYLRFGSSNGHPQLSHALIEGLKRRGWPQDDLANLAAIMGSDEAINRTKDEIRRRLLLELPEDARLLIYRLSLITSPFDISLVKVVGDVASPLQAPGEILDSLVGPWIDKLNNDEFQLSPLLSGIGPLQLGQTEQQGVHSAIARALVKDGTIDSRRIDQLLLSGLAGKAEDALLAFVIATLSSEVEKIPLLASYCFALVVLRTDRLIYPDNRRLSIQLRAIQALFCLTEGSRDQFQSVLDAFETELKELDNDKNQATLRLALSGKLTLMPQLAEAYPEFPKLILQTVQCANALGIDSVYELPGDEDGYSGATLGIGPALFIQQMTNIKTLKCLSKVVESLSTLSVSERNRLVPVPDSIRFNPEHIVKSVWVRLKDKPEYNSNKCYDEVLEFAHFSAQLGQRDFAIGAYITAAAIQGEELANLSDALALLEQTELELGSDFALSRAMAGIHFMNNDFGKQVEVIEPRLHEMLEEGWIERAYLYRELAIAHGNLGDWEKCFQRFDQARKFAAKAKIESMTLMEIGLQADSAVALWNLDKFPDALRVVNDALTRIEVIDPSSGFRQRALHRLVRFTGFWMYTEYKELRKTLPDVEAEMVIGCSSNPNPHTGLDVMPEGPVKMIKYLLAQVDIGTGLAAGIWRDEVSCFTPEEAVLSLECSLYIEAFREALKAGSPERIIEFGPLYIDASTEFKLRKFTEKDWNEQGKVPRASETEWANERNDIIYQIAGFMLNAIAADDSDLVRQFIHLNHTSDRPLLDSDEIRCLLDGISMASNPAQSIFGAVGVLQSSLALGSRPAVPELFMTSVRLLDILRFTDGLTTCAHLVATWAFDKWEEALREERFRFRTPLLAEQEIYTVLSSVPRDLSGLGRLVLAAHSYVDVRLSTEHINQLKKFAEAEPD